MISFSRTILPLLLCTGALSTTTMNGETVGTLSQRLYPQDAASLSALTASDLHTAKSVERTADASETLLIPMIWNGVAGSDGSATVALLTNRTAQPAKVTIEFFDAAGNRADLPLTSPAGRHTAIGGTLAPRALAGFVTQMDNNTEQRLMARVTVSPAGSIGISGFLLTSRQDNLSILAIAATAPSASRVVTSAMISTTATATLFVASAASTTRYLKVSVTDNSGRTLCQTTAEVPAMGYREISFRDNLTCLRFFDGPATVTVESTGTPSLAFAGYHSIATQLGSIFPDIR